MNREERRRPFAASNPGRPAAAKAAQVVFAVLDARPPGGSVGGRRVWFVPNPRTYGIGLDLGVCLPVDEYDAGRFDGEIEGAEVVTVETLNDLPARFSWFGPFGERSGRDG